MKAKWTLFLLIAVIFLGAQIPASAEVQNGQAAPDFTLTDVGGEAVSLSDFDGKYRVLEWTNHECPFVVKHYGSGNMQSLQKAYTEKDVVWITINSSAHGKQGHFEPEKWVEVLEEKGSAATTTLLDADGEVGKLYGAKTTPHMYIIDPKGVLIYQGAIDSVASTDPDDIAESVNYVSQALDEAMAGKPVSEPATKAYGCSVKY